VLSSHIRLFAHVHQPTTFGKPFPRSEHMQYTASTLGQLRHLYLVVLDLAWPHHGRLCIVIWTQQLMSCAVLVLHPNSHIVRAPCMQLARRKALHLSHKHTRAHVQNSHPNTLGCCAHRWQADANAHLTPEEFSQKFGGCASDPVPTNTVVRTSSTSSNQPRSTPSVDWRTKGQVGQTLRCRACCMLLH
jgi:hypothetical protein